MQGFGDVSQGMFGSLGFILRFSHCGSALALIFAIATILSLGVVLFA
jgi:hypothetical protein